MTHEVQSKQTDPGVIVITGRVELNDKSDDDYIYLPFSVPPGLTRLDVEYDFGRTSMSRSRAGEENILDLGIFSPGSGTTSPGDFRGWSGGARSGFFISPEDATPGYLAGSMSEGTWHIILGLYRIATEGCDYTVTIRMSTEQESRGAPDVQNVTGTGTGAGSVGPRRWYVGDLQSHTYHSDAKASPAEIARVARDRRLDFLAVTDHNTISHHAELDALSSEDLLLIPGTEITTYYGHANAWGVNHWVDFRCRSDSDVPERVESVHEQGALFSVNHPYSDCRWTFGWVDGIDAIEVWHALWNDANVSAVRWWDELLTSGLRITGVGGSDRHEPAIYDPYFPHQVGTPATRVFADGLSTQGILDGIQAGRVTIAASPSGPWAELTILRSDGSSVGMGEGISVRAGDELLVRCTVHDAGDHVVQLISDGRQIAHRELARGENNLTISVTVGDAAYIRAQVVSRRSDSDAESRHPRICALTNPVYLVRNDGEGGSSRAAE